MSDKEQVIIIELEEGIKQLCYVVGMFEMGERTYISLLPDDGTDDIYLYRLNEHGNSFDLEEIPERAEFDNAIEEFNRVTLGNE